MFDWDEANIDHIALHDVEPEEAEAALTDPHRHLIARRTVRNEQRIIYIGATESGRALVVVYTRRGERLRVVTAREATAEEVRRWRRQQK